MSEVYTWTQEWATARGIKFWNADETPSTNTIAKNEESVAPAAPQVSKISEPALYLAKRQTAGRGRGSNSWESANGALLSSWVFRCTSAPQPILAPLAGLALFEALGSVFSGLRLSLKAPNDVFSFDKKIAGLLIETVITGRDVKTVIGLGLNVMSSPGSIETAGAISDSAHVDRSLWLGFLDAWRAKLQIAAEAGLETSLSHDVRARLRDALNMNPLRKDRVMTIGPQGEIETAHGFVHWHQL